jgi:hypothetical protein
MIMPNFLIIGAGKSGTTAMYHYLKQHPQIYMSPVKEPHFFASAGGLPTFGGPIAQPPRRKVLDFNEYLALFDGVMNETAIGEASVTNFRPESCVRIQHYLPDGKFICVLRQPVDRAYSQFIYARREIWEPSNVFLDAYRAAPIRRRENWWPVLIYENQRWYNERLQDWFARFRKDQFRIYLYDDWLRKPLIIIQDIFGFLNVDTSFVPDMSIRHNVGRLPRSRALKLFVTQPNPIKTLAKLCVPPSLRHRWASAALKMNEITPPPLEPEIRRQLTAEHREEILKLQDLIERDLSHWLTA